MKKLVLIFTLYVTIAISLAAQSLKKTERISNEQVPVAIVRAFEIDFGKVPDAGYWTANYIVEQEGTRSIAKTSFVLLSQAE